MPAPKNIVCLFRGQGDKWVRVAGLIDSGNLVPGSAAMSVAFAQQIGASWNPHCSEVGTAAQGGGLEVVGKIPTLQMVVSPTLILTLTDTIVMKNLSHPLNLSLQFLKECEATLDYAQIEPQLLIKGEHIPMVAKIEIWEQTMDEVTRAKRDLREETAAQVAAGLQRRQIYRGRIKSPLIR